MQAGSTYELVFAFWAVWVDARVLLVVGHVLVGWLCWLAPCTGELH